MTAITLHIHLDGEPPEVEHYYTPDRGPLSVIDVGGGVKLFARTPAQCDALIRAAVEAKSHLAPARLDGSVHDPDPDNAPRPEGEPGARDCGARDGEWICTARRGHGDDHAAYDEDGNKLHSWPQTAPGRPDNGWVEDMPDSERCDLLDLGYHCTAATGHDGDHMAWGCRGELCHTWPQTVNLATTGARL